MGLKTAIQRRRRYLTDGDYRAEERELRRLDALADYTHATSNVLGPTLALNHPGAFASQYRGIFGNELLAVDFDRPDPFVIDCGANVGLSVLYWLRLAPRARVLAFEADPAIAELLRQNMTAAGVSDNVEVVAAAAWIEQGHIAFAQEGGDAGRIGAGREVPAVRFRDYLDRPVDLLKMDIEGAERFVIPDCADQLHNVRSIFLEYHSIVGEPQRLSEVIRPLEEAGFRLIVKHEYAPKQPLRALTPMGDMDVRLDIFGVRSG